MTRLPQPPPSACSVQWDSPELPAYGSAARATFWVALEQDGPWGHDPITMSHLDPDLGASLGQACATAGGRLLLIRRPDEHADAGEGRRTVLVAGGLTTTPWLVRGTVTDPRVLLDLPFADLPGDPLEPHDDVAATVASLVGGEVDPGAALLVCTNGKRDVCCAVRGRPVAHEAAALRPGRVWECSHTGGHRFAPTGIVLPVGHTLGRLTPVIGADAVDAAARGELAASALGPVHDRGRSALHPAAQAAEAWVREQTGLTGLDDVRVRLATAENGSHLTAHASADGREWTLRCEQVRTETARPDSCGRPPVPSVIWKIAPQD